MLTQYTIITMHTTYPNCYSSKPRYHADPIYHIAAPSLTSQAPGYRKLYFSKYNFSCGFLLTRRKIYCRIRRHKGNGVFERKLEGAFFFNRISGHRDEGKDVFCITQEVSLPFIICKLPAFGLNDIVPTTLIYLPEACIHQKGV